jgi:hypothetical protein
MNKDLRAPTDCELTPPMLDLIEILARIAYESLKRERTESATTDVNAA